MEVHSVIFKLTIFLLFDSNFVKNNVLAKEQLPKNFNDSDDIFKDVYKDCLVSLSFPCVQRKTLMYLKQLNNMSEVSIVGDYIKFVRLNTSDLERKDDYELTAESSSEDLTKEIDQAIDRFFNSHIIRFNALGRDISIANNEEEFVGRKKHKGGGAGMIVAHDGGHFSHKKMMMMAMMCMKMKMMMIIPAMMGMMGMMSFKGMMFSMMSFMVSKMMLLMKILEKKGALGGSSSSGGSDGGWAAGGSSGGAWMPAGGQDFAAGGYDANGQWQSRSIIEDKEIYSYPIISHKEPILSYSNPNKINTIMNKITSMNNHVINVTKNPAAVKTRRKRSIIDAIQNSYIYWINKLLGFNNNRRTSNIPKYKLVNGIKYVYYPYAYRQIKVKTPKEIQDNKIKNSNEETPVIMAADFNKGEIMEGAVESRMIRKKIQKMKDNVNETVDENPWE